MWPAFKTMFCFCAHSKTQLKIRRLKPKRNELGDNDNQGKRVTATKARMITPDPFTGIAHWVTKLSDSEAKITGP